MDEIWDGSFCEVLDNAEEQVFVLENAKFYWNNKKMFLV